MKLKAQKREVVGKKVKNLRNEGLVPASVYGPGKDPLSLQLDLKEFKKIYDKAGNNKFVDLEIDGSKPVKVLIKEVQQHPVKDTYLNIALYRINEDRKLVVDVPVNFVGESVVETNKLGFLVRQMETLKVYALPSEIPAEIKVDVSKILEPGESITVGDIELPEGATWDSSLEPTNAIIYAVSMQKAEAEAEAALESAEVEAPAEGEEAAEEVAEGGEAQATENKE